MKELRVGEVCRAFEECIQGLLGSGYDGCVIPEEQASDDGDEHYRKQIGSVLTV